jgi:hypothetical protein
MGKRISVTLRGLTPGPDAGPGDFLARADILRTLGFDVLISRFEQHYQLADYLAAYTDGQIGIAAGLPSVRQQVADEKYYTELPGGVLESVGRLFKRSAKMYVYPTRDPVTSEVLTVRNEQIPAPWHHLRNLLLDIGRIVFNPTTNPIFRFRWPTSGPASRKTILRGRRWSRRPSPRSSKQNTFFVLPTPHVRNGSR